MKVAHWIALGLVSFVFVSSLGQMTSHRGADSGTIAVSQPVPSPVFMAQARNAKQPTVIKSGNFKSGEHPTQGNARIVTQNGKSFLELGQGFKTSSSGPDLVVVLHRSNNVLGSTTPPDYPLKNGDYIVLAPLRKFNGAQRYAIPANVNLANFQSAAIWCRKFNATFGAATLGYPAPTP